MKKVKQSSGERRRNHSSNKEDTDREEDGGVEEAERDGVVAGYADVKGCEEGIGGAEGGGEEEVGKSGIERARVVDEIWKIENKTPLNERNENNRRSDTVLTRSRNNLAKNLRRMNRELKSKNNNNNHNQKVHFVVQNTNSNHPHRNHSTRMKPHVMIRGDYTTPGTGMKTVQDVHRNDNEVGRNYERESEDEEGGEGGEEWGIRDGAEEQNWDEDGDKGDKGEKNEARGDDVQEDDDLGVLLTFSRADVDWFGSILTKCSGNDESRGGNTIVGAATCYRN